jgi:cytochrome c-type biogenesis protein CcmH/NrfF
MSRWKNNFLMAAALAAVTLMQTGTAQTRGQIDVRRVGARLACQCGCPDTVATCSMLECSFSRPARDRIAKAQAAGVSDQDIINGFIKEYGQEIYRAEPNAFGWIVPYTVLALGFLVIAWFFRRYYYRKPANVILPAGDEPGLSRYREQIEKDIAHLE